MTKMVFWKCPITTHNRGVKKQKQNQNTTKILTVLGQFCKLIPKYCLANVCAELNKEGIKIAAMLAAWDGAVYRMVGRISTKLTLRARCRRVAIWVDALSSPLVCAYGCVKSIE